MAIVLFNLGGPDRIESVRPFLENLFRDPAILRVPGFIRPWLGKFIARRRTKAASENYAILGGGSPLLELTEEQARSLEAALAGEADAEYRCFIAMRYWHPMSDACAARGRRLGRRTRCCCCRSIRNIPPPRPAAAWRNGTRRRRKAGIDLPTTTLCCWHSDPAFAAATAAMVRGACDRARAELPPDVQLRILFSAHGLPESIVKSRRPLPVAGRAGGGRGGRRSSAMPESRPRRLLPVPRHAAEMDRPQHRGWSWSGRRMTRSPCWSARSPSSPSIPRPWSSWMSNTARRPSASACPAISACPAQNSDPGFIAALRDLVLRARGPAAGRSAASPAAGNARSAFGDCPHAKAKPRVKELA